MPDDSLETQIEQWRNYLRRRQAIHAVDLTELEDHLREQIGELMANGLNGDEAFLVAVKRMGNLDALSHEFAREHSERLWKQLVLTTSSATVATGSPRRETAVAFGLAAAAAIAIKLPALLGVSNDDETFYARNAAFLVVPMLIAYFAWKRKVAARTIGALVVAFVSAAVVVNVLPHLLSGGHSAAAHATDIDLLSALHMPIILWLLVGVAYAAQRWSSVAGRMDFVRYTGELFIYYALIAMGGGVFSAFMALIFEAIGIKVEPFLAWVIPCGAAGAVIVGSWLVEAKQSVIENMAPVLTRLFSPLFAILLVAFLATMLVTGRGIGVDRNILVAFDGLLALVLCLLLYTISARDPRGAPAGADMMQVVLVAAALIADVAALWAIGHRIETFGLTPNRVAALGENIILLVNLAWSLVLYVRFLRGRGTFEMLERWQTRYLLVYPAWAAVVVAAFPPLFASAQ